MSPPIHPLTSSQGAVFLLNSRQRNFRCGRAYARQALSRSYGRFFAEFLNEDSPVPLGLLALSTCGGFRYGFHTSTLEVFLERALYQLASTRMPTLASTLEFATKRRDADLPTPHSRVKDAKPLRHLMYCALSPHRTMKYGRAGILTSFPSASAFAIALGPPHPPPIRVAEETLDFRGAGFSPTL